MSKTALLSSPLFFAVLLIACSGSERPAPIRLETPTEIPSPAGPGSQVPYLATGPDGSLWMSWMEERAGGGHRFAWSRLEGEEWTAPVTIAEGDSFFVNWADFPTVRPLADNLVYAHWPWRNGAGTYAYDVRIAVSHDGGASWDPPVIPHDDGTATEHGFVTMIGHEEGALLIWLDGRNFADASSDDPHGHGHGEEGAPGPEMMLRSAYMEPDGTLRRSAVIDERVCECCQTDGVPTSRGPLVVYRGRSEDEVRDIRGARFDGEWTEPVAISSDGWQIEGCPVNGAAIAVAEDRLGVAWYTEAGERPSVYFRSSADGGETFGEPVQIDLGAPLGRTDLVVLDDGTALVLWMEETDSGAGIFLRTVTPAGELGEERLIAATSGSRASGFPKFVRQDDRLVFAWTDVDSARVRVAVTSIAGA